MAAVLICCQTMISLRSKEQDIKPATLSSSCKRLIWVPALDPARSKWSRYAFTRTFETRTTGAKARASGSYPSSQGGTAQLLIWREGTSPHFRLTTPDEASALTRLSQGASLGQLATEQDPEQLGPWLAGWLAEGMFSGFWVAG